MYLLFLYLNCFISDASFVKRSLFKIGIIYLLYIRRFFQITKQCLLSGRNIVIINSL